MYDWLIYILIIAGLFLLGWGGIKLKRKFNINQEEIGLLNLILNVTDYITSKFEFKYKKGVSIIVQYCFEAISFINNYEDITDLEIKKELVKEKAAQICIENGLEIDDGTIEIVDEIVNYIFKNVIVD